jgi:hypothetical protein
MDTDMAKGVEAEKADPADIARVAIDAIAAGTVEIIADDISGQVRAGLAGGAAALYPDFA